MIKRGWKEFRAIGCRRWVLLLYDFRWFCGWESAAANLLYRELHDHCKISQETLEEIFREVKDAKQD